MKYKALNLLFAALGTSLFSPSGLTEDTQQFDASDPTKIYSFLGGGPKYVDYTNDEHMVEFRLIGNLALGPNDMLLIETGYGKHSGNSVPGPDSDWTNTRLRWFHLFDMQYDLTSGYRGMGLQLDVQLAGQLKGTDGQNVINAGVMPVWALSEKWNLYLSLNLVNSWDKRFEQHNGVGAGFDAQIIYNPDWWPGSQLRILPAYSYFVDGDLEDEGSGNLDINIGGEFNSSTMWDLTAQKNFDKDLTSYRRGRDTGLENDWNVFFNVTRYF
ncbi:MAG: hypothetical protein V7709_08890 [Halioglobus sp.]